MYLGLFSIVHNEEKLSAAAGGYPENKHSLASFFQSAPLFLNDNQLTFTCMNCVMHPHPPCSVSDHWSPDSGVIVIYKLLIPTKYEGKNPLFDVRTKRRTFKLKTDSKSNAAVSNIHLSPLKYCCHGDKMHLQCFFLTMHKHFFPAIQSALPAFFCPKNKQTNKKPHYLDTAPKEASALHPPLPVLLQLVLYFVGCHSFF